MNSEAEWEVFRVINSKVDLKCSFLYLVHWEDPWDDTWEPSESLCNASEVLEAFHCSCSHKLKSEAQELSLKPFNDEENEEGFWVISENSDDRILKNSFFSIIWLSNKIL